MAAATMVAAITMVAATTTVEAITMVAEITISRMIRQSTSQHLLCQPRRLTVSSTAAV
jgi:hypothetical protein